MATSLTYFAGLQTDAMAQDDSGAMAAFQRDVLLEGIAADLALLISATEVLP